MMFQAFQTAVFKNVAEYLKGRFPHKSLGLVYADELVLKDMEFLKANNKLRMGSRTKVASVYGYDGRTPDKTSCLLSWGAYWICIWVLL